mmetsp:Transcript_53366/g.140752  ORF Transcript_53366/g.140752 Transcript_53366/m.140752 type:complete len:234 (+) Transcript_53366:1804-2505(+)
MSLISSISRTILTSSWRRTSVFRLCSLSCLSRLSFFSSCTLMSALDARRALSLPSRVVLSSAASLSRRSRRRCSRSASVLFALSMSLMLPISTSPCAFSDSCFCTVSVRVMLSCVIFVHWASSLSRFRRRSSRCWTRLFTVFSWFTLRPAPCSTRWLRLAISTFRLWIVSLARCSFSWEASTIFHALSISFLRFWMVDWSSLERFRAVCTLFALETISWFSSRHFLMSRFSLS